MPVNKLLAALLIILLVTAVAIACYLVYRIIVKRREAAEPVTPAEEKEIVVEPIQRYIWDKDELAWVQASEPKPEEPSGKASPDSSAGVRQDPGKGVGAKPSSATAASTAQTQKQTTTTAPQSEQKAAARKQTLPMAGKKQPDEQESADLYSGTVELLISPPLSLTSVRRFNERLTQLRQTHKVEVMNVEQSRSEGITMQLYMRAPVKLVKILGSLPEVDTVSTGFNKFRGVKPEQPAVAKSSARRIIIRLKS